MLYNNGEVLNGPQQPVMLAVRLDRLYNIKSTVAATGKGKLKTLKVNLISELKTVPLSRHEKSV